MLILFNRSVAFIHSNVPIIEARANRALLFFWYHLVSLLFENLRKPVPSLTDIVCTRP
jgi:hypothetical protein